MNGIHPSHHCPKHGQEACYVTMSTTSSRERHFCSGKNGEPGSVHISWLEANPYYRKIRKMEALVTV